MQVTSLIFGTAADTQDHSAVPKFLSQTSLIMATLENVQGDIFSRGFSKRNETYYFFTIDNGKDFVKALKQLIPDHISSLATVIDQWTRKDGIDEVAKWNRTPANAKNPKPDVEVKNALIALSMKGLEKVRLFSMKTGFTVLIV